MGSAGPTTTIMTVVIFTFSSRQECARYSRTVVEIPVHFPITLLIRDGHCRPCAALWWEFRVAGTRKSEDWISVTHTGTDRRHSDRRTLTTGLWPLTQRFLGMQSIQTMKTIVSSCTVTEYLGSPLYIHGCHTNPPPHHCFDHCTQHRSELFFNVSSFSNEVEKCRAGFQCRDRYNSSVARSKDHGIITGQTSPARDKHICS